MNDEKIERMLREVIVLMSWCQLGNFFLQAKYPKAYAQTHSLVLSFIKSYGTKKDQEVLGKIPGLVEIDIAERKDNKKKGISIETEADKATKRWVGDLLKDIGGRLEEQG